MQTLIRRSLWFLAGVLVALKAHPAPFITSDPWPAGTIQPTHCGIVLDAQPKVDSPVAKDASGGVYCHHDIAGLLSGAHTATATAVLIDPVWGRLESAPSPPFSFTQPAAAAATPPAALTLSPK